MSTLKTRFDEGEARQLLDGLYPEVREVTALAGGEASQAYGFMSGDCRLVLRVNHQFSYALDAWASRMFAERLAPAPQVIRTGQQGALHWAVSERAAGTTLDNLTPAEIAPLRAGLIQTLIAIHETPIQDSTGFGHVDEAGNAAHSSWRAFLEGEGRFGSFVDWDRALSQAGDRQRRLVEASWRVVNTLLPLCPEERAFNHGDFSLDNILADGLRITGVVDWSNCLYGDPVRDVAWADLWAPGLGLAGAYFQTKTTENGEARLMCYQLLIAAESLGFYLHTEQPEKGDWLAGQVEALLREADGKRLRSSASSQ